MPDSYEEPALTKKSCALTCLIVLLFAAVAVADPASKRDWPVWSGPDGNMTSLGNDVFGDRFGLETAWSRPLGSAYSGIAVVGGRLVLLLPSADRD